MPANSECYFAGTIAVTSISTSIQGHANWLMVSSVCAGIGVEPLSFVPVSLVGKTVVLLMVNASSDIKSVGDLIAKTCRASCAWHGMSLAVMG